MAEISMDRQLEQGEESSKNTIPTDEHKNLAQNVDENENTESALEHTKPLETCMAEEKNNVTSKMNDSSTKVIINDEMFDEKVSEKDEPIESKTLVDSISNRESCKNNELTTVDAVESNEIGEQRSTSVESIEDSSSNGAEVSPVPIIQTGDAAEDHCKEHDEIKSEPTSKNEEITVNMSNDTEECGQKIENLPNNQTTAVDNVHSNEEITEKTEEKSEFNEANELTGNISQEAESPPGINSEGTISAGVKTNEDTQNTDVTPSVESETVPQEGTSVQEAPASLETSNAVWYTDKAEREASSPKLEGYSTTVVGGVVVRKPLSSSSSSPEHKKSSPVSTRGSKFKMSWGSIFKRKTSKSDMKPTETEQHDANDGVMEDSSPVAKESTQEVDNIDAGKEESANSVEESTKTAEDSLQTTEPAHEESNGKEVQTQGGEIVPIEEGLAEADIETSKEPSVDNNEESPPDEDKVLRERIAKRQSWTPTSSPEKHMQMRVSYAEGSNAGEKEVEVIGTREVVKRSHADSKSKLPDNHRYSCRELGDVDHEGWLAKKGGGAIFSSWKRKWVVLKERHLYYFKTSFDIEAGGVIFLDEKCSIGVAPELKRKYAFKVDFQDPKAQKLFLAADSQEAMDKWLSVLSAARRGEVIIRKGNQQSNDNVKMRKKTSSMSKRCGSVLGIGGIYEYDGNLQKTSPTQRRASFGSSPKENQKQLGLTVISSDGEVAPPKELNKQEKHEEAHVPATPISVPEKTVAEANIEKTNESELEKTEEMSLTIESTDKVDPVPPNDESNASIADKKDEEIQQELTLSQEGPPSEESPSSKEELNIAPFEQVVACTEEQPNQSEEKCEEVSQLAGKTEQVSQSQVTSEQTKLSEESTEEISLSKNTSEEVSQIGEKTEEISQSEERTVQVSQSQNTTAQVSQSQNTTAQVSQSRDTTEQISQSEEKTEVKGSTEIVRESSRSSISKSNRTSSSTWYLVLDAKNDVWVEFQYKPKNNDDELLSLVKTIKDARITITGTPLPGNEGRGRAMTLVSPRNAEVLKLNELKRSLKSKERDLKAVDELLSQDINRKSLHEWSNRYSDLAEDIIGEPLDDIDQDSKAKHGEEMDASERNDSDTLKAAEKNKENVCFDTNETEEEIQEEVSKTKDSEEESNTEITSSEECQDSQNKAENDKMPDIEHEDIASDKKNDKSQGKGVQDENYSRKDIPDQEDFDTKL